MLGDVARLLLLLLFITTVITCRGGLKKKEKRSCLSSNHLFYSKQPLAIVAIHKSTSSGARGHMIPVRTREVGLLIHFYYSPLFLVVRLLVGLLLYSLAGL